MKAGLFLAALVQLAAAQPHRRGHHQHQHERREELVVTQVDVVTALAPNVVVYVNAAGEPISTSIGTQATEAPAAVVSSVKTVASAIKPAVAVSSTPVQAKVAVAAPAPAVKSSAAASSPALSSSVNSGYGIAYDPYTASGGCKTAQQVMTDFEQLGGYSLVRIYGTDCGQVPSVLSAAKAHNMKLMLGVFDLSDVAGDIATIVAAIGTSWDMVETVSIGNELVNSGEASAAEVVAALGVARPLLKLAGFGGNVVTVDTFNALIANPELCQASDFAAANAHAFFDPDVSAPGAGQWASSTAQSVQKACGKKVVITESGWPSAGDANGAAVPSPANQQAAISSLKSAFADGGIILFSAYNDLWKANSAGTFDSEKSWGIYGDSSS